MHKNAFQICYEQWLIVMKAKHSKKLDPKWNVLLDKTATEETFEFRCLSVISSQWHWTSHPHQLAETCDTFPAKSGRNSTWTFSRFGNKEILDLVFQLKMNCSRFLLELMTEVFVKTRNSFPPSCTEKVILL